MLYTLRFFSSKCSLFHNANLFGFCIIHILYTECAKMKKNNSGAKGLRSGVNGHGPLKQKGVNHTDEKQRLGVYYLSEFYT